MSYFMYVDESGDPGMVGVGSPGGPSLHYIVTGLIIHQDDWRNVVNDMHVEKRYIRTHYGLPVREELHGVELINPRKSGPIKAIKGGRKARVDIYRHALMNFTAIAPKSKIINVCLDKQYFSTYKKVPDIQSLAWERLLQRFQTHLQKDCANEKGLIFSDQTNEIKLRKQIRKMRVYNRVPSHFGGTYQANLVNLIEDPIIRSSSHSYLIQYADLISHALYRYEYPKGSYRRFQIDRLFEIVDPLLLKSAGTKDPKGKGIVRK